MKKYGLIVLSFVFTISLSPIICAADNSSTNNPVTNNSPFLTSTVLAGKLLVIDLNGDGKANKDSVLNGSDLVLGRISNDNSHKFPTFKVETIGDIADLQAFDANHDGVIQRDELAASNIVVIRFAPDHSISLIPLAVSNIQEIHYQGGLTQSKLVNQPLNVWLTGPNNKKYSAYYVNF